MEPLWLCRDNFIRTSVRKVAGWADNAFRRVAWEDAQVLILLPPSEKKNTTTKPTPAINVYTGVLYQALDWASLTIAARKRGASAVVIISAKYGAVRPDQLIESYKEKIDNNAMRAPVGKVLDAIKTPLIVDCRSSTYKTVWHSPVEKTVEVRVSTVVDGVRTVVTHMSKKTRGEITRWLLQSRSMPKTPEDLYAIVSEKYPCALTPSDGQQPWVLEVIAV
ncbi:MAG: peroxide stress protein YaaA [Actinobacteria bacterium]|jgi:cytoplasmic iron level regulating protein YaaA (DUF328/UPF0246 family)|nr:peroxide stress protein YaaA [Actinomycetota bacterium]MSW30748.1 peroxide stress protein YaaA [Actinomycetota bacterium]MSY14834.1 peroxide stress protein YaaA [Actinomycetota bacterium]